MPDIEIPKAGETFLIEEFELTRKDVKELKQLSLYAFRDRRIDLYSAFRNISALNNYKFLRKVYLKSLTKEK